jgi:hypothetical protein
MLSVRGVFQNSAVRLLQPVAARDGQSVIVTFLDEVADIVPFVASPSSEEADWDAFDRLTEACIVRTGITDLAHQHDHYLYGKPKIE